mmetsp:Transcript_22444/g.56114  ORF Transcript_22444/g.56114 Transcript_22444/m.56114 type:complete len:338 (+) Transcript_22444:59-1072(+)
MQVNQEHSRAVARSAVADGSGEEQREAGPRGRRANPGKRDVGTTHWRTTETSGKSPNGRTMGNFFEEPDAEDAPMACCESPRGSDPSPRGSQTNDPVNLALLLAERYGFGGASPPGGVSKRTRCISPVDAREHYSSPSSSRSPSPTRQHRCSLVGQDLQTNMTSHGIARQCAIGAAALVVLASAGTMRPKLSRSVEIDYSHSHHAALLHDAATHGVPIPDGRMARDHRAPWGSDQELCAPFDAESRQWAGGFYEWLAAPEGKDGTCIRLRGGKQAAGEAQHDSHPHHETLALRGGVTCVDCANEQVKQAAGDGSLAILGGKSGSAGFRPKLSRTVDS